jgi:cytochrome c
MAKDALFWNKIAGAVLTAGLGVMVVGEIGGILYHVEQPEEQIFTIGTGEAQTASADAAPEEPTGPEDILPILASADPSAGEKVARKCAGCHSFEQGGANKVGPNLWNTLNMDIASHEGFSYSGALSDKEGTWDFDKMNHFLYAPKEWAPGTKMSFNGVKDTQDRADLIAYLRTLAEDPRPLPEQ